MQHMQGESQAEPFTPFVDDKGRILSNQRESIQKGIGELTGQVQAFCRDHPVAAMGGAALLGFIVARVVSR